MWPIFCWRPCWWYSRCGWRRQRSSCRRDLCSSSRLPRSRCATLGCHSHNSAGGTGLQTIFPRELMKAPLYDAHNHLHDERLGPHLAGILKTVEREGIVRMVVNGSCEEDWHAVMELARRYPRLVLPSFGYHPWYVRERSPDWQQRLIGFLDDVPA